MALALPIQIGKRKSRLSQEDWRVIWLEKMRQALPSLDRNLSACKQFGNYQNKESAGKN
jgi:hypothetical protein